MKAPAKRLIGYARVSADKQSPEPQEIELRSAGCHVIIQKHGSGSSRGRPALSRLFREIGPGDTLVIVRLDCLARSVSQLLEVIEAAWRQGMHIFRSLCDPIDTTTPQGMFSLQVLGAVAQAAGHRVRHRLSLKPAAAPWFLDLRRRWRSIAKKDR
jgi:DNA invertase Pin-like site-specific DNA recombinase